jgi:hypothetical protein
MFMMENFVLVFFLQLILFFKRISFQYTAKEILPNILDIIFKNLKFLKNI